MMTEYQKMKFDELVDLLKEAIEISDEGELTHNSKRLKEILCVAENIRGNKAGNNDESAIMNAYFQGKRLELFQSIDGIPFVCPGDDVYECTGIALDRFVELLGMRQAREGMPKEDIK